jgi:hypothetical protein
MLQHLINILYRFPKGKLKTYRRFGGYRNYRITMKGNEKMRSAAKYLPVHRVDPDGLPVYFLTGKNYIHQTLFCINSLLKVSGEKYHFFLVDDGTFTQEITDLVAQKLPGCTIIDALQISGNLEKYMNEDEFPVLRHKRKVYPHIKKITDIHTIPPFGWKLVMDSDMLFWKEPIAVDQWLRQPDQPVYMVDCAESYGYSPGLMQQLSGKRIPDFLNVGIIGLDGSKLRWEDIEMWVRELEEKEGRSYYLEQALSAMIVGEQQSTVLNIEEYKVNPGISDLENKRNVLHHYVDLSKQIYYQEAWKLIL